MENSIELQLDKESTKESPNNLIDSCDIIFDYIEKTSNDLVVKKDKTVQDFNLINFKFFTIKIIISHIKHKKSNEKTIRLSFPMNSNEQIILDLFSDLINEKIISIVFNYSSIQTTNKIPHSFNLEWSNTDLLVQSLLKIKIENTI